MKTPVLVYKSGVVRGSTLHGHDNPDERIIHANYKDTVCDVQLGEILNNVTHMSRNVRKPTMWILTRSDTNQAVQLLKMVRGLKFWI